MPRPGGVSLPIKLVKILPLPEGAFANLKILVVAVDGQGVRCVGLQLYGIRASLGSSVNYSHRRVKVLLVVGRHFRNDICG